MYGIIYKATNTLNNKVYIGQTTQDLNSRISSHKHRAKYELDIHTHFINALRKYGFENFIWEIIDQAENQNELDDKEKYWIQYYDSINTGYNIQEGGSSMKSEQFLATCGCRPFVAYRTNGEYLGKFHSQKEFSRLYNIADTHVSDLVNNKLNSCNGYIIILESEFSDQLLQEKIKKARNTYRPFVAIDLNTFERFGPYNSIKECKESLHLKSNHIGEILKKHRKSQEGYTFKFIEELDNAE